MILALLLVIIIQMMIGLNLVRHLQEINQLNTGVIAAAGLNTIWSKKHDDIIFTNSRSSGMSSLPARQELLRIDEQVLLEQAHMNLYCSRCSELLLEGSSQIVMYEKSLQQKGAAFVLPNRTSSFVASLAS